MLTSSVEKLKPIVTMKPLSPEKSLALLFEGIDSKTVDFTPIFKMAAELFTHLGIACTYSPLVC
jgi:hypothetical protein